MKYEELLGMCQRVVGLAPDSRESLTDVVSVLNQFTPFPRQIACEKLAMLMAEFIEEPIQQSLRSTKH